MSVDPNSRFGTISCPRNGADPLSLLPLNDFRIKHPVHGPIYRQLPMNHVPSTDIRLSLVSLLVVVSVLLLLLDEGGRAIYHLVIYGAIN